MNHNYLNIVTREEIFSVTHPFLSHKALPFKVRSWSLDLFQDIKRTSVQTSIWVISTNEFIIFRCIFSALHPMSLMLWKDWEPYTLSTPLSSPALTVELILGQLWLFSRVSPDWTNSYLSQSNSPPPHFIYQKSTHQKECPTQGKKKKSQLNVGLKLKRLEIEKLPVLTAHLLTWGFTAPEIMPGLWKWKLAVRKRWLMTAKISHVIGQAFSVIAFFNQTGLRNRG